MVTASNVDADEDHDDYTDPAFDVDAHDHPADAADDNMNTRGTSTDFLFSPPDSAEHTPLSRRPAHPAPLQYIVTPCEPGHTESVRHKQTHSTRIRFRSLQRRSSHESTLACTRARQQLHHTPQRYVV